MKVWSMYSEMSYGSRINEFLTTSESEAKKWEKDQPYENGINKIQEFEL